MIKLNEFVCDEFTKELKAGLVNDYIDDKNLKLHIENCDVCKTGLKKFALQITKNLNPMQILSMMKQ